ncbi:hypothetical protein N657DRAFT_649060, partial [Parathielavia appendiculata]
SSPRDLRTCDHCDHLLDGDPGEPLTVTGLARDELSGFLGIHGLSTDVQCETLSQHRSITMTQFLP